MASNKFSNADLLRLQQKGLNVIDPIMQQKTEKAFGLPRTKPKTIKRSSPGKDHIEFVLIALKMPFVKEYKFSSTRKFRFDFAIIDMTIKIAIEYEGIYAAGKSRHTTTTGYSTDLQKYNLATVEGWKILRYSANNYMNFGSDIKIILAL